MKLNLKLNNKYIIGVSYGPDSMALLDLFLKKVIKYISNLIDKIKNLFISFFGEVLILCFSLFNNHFKIQTRKVKIHLQLIAR